jgi:hypothetical protein
MNSYVIITSLKQNSEHAYATFNAAIDAKAERGLRFSEDAILIRFDGGLDMLFTLLNEHIHDGDELVIFPVTDGKGLFCHQKTASLFRHALGED